MTSLASPIHRSLLVVSHWLRLTSDPSAGDRVTPTPFVAPALSEPPPRRSRLRQGMTAAAVVAGVLGAAGVVTIKRIPSAGPLVADTLRSIVGVQNVIRLEEAAAGVDDRLQQFSSAMSAPRDTAQALAVEPAPPTSEPSAAFSLPPVSPMHRSVASASDGRWVPIRAESERSTDAPRMLLTLIHPDWHRTYAELFVVALDATRVNLHAVPGTTEPLSATPEAKSLTRTGLIPDADRGALLGAFNGGFKTVHGQYGMQVGGLTVLPAQRYACTVGFDAQGQLRIAPWERGVFTQGEWQWWRQTPPCLYENGKMHPGLTVDDNLAWGAALKGSTVTRRSAIGVSRDGKVIYIGIGNELTARALATGMNHAGAADVAQLDINWSYPRFVVFKTGESGELEATSLLRGFNVGADDYLRDANPRDFFYVTAK